MITKPQKSEGINHLQEDFEDFFEQSVCGFIITNTSGAIVRSNNIAAKWAGVTPEELRGKKFSDLLTIGGKIYFETHLWPLLRMQGFFDEVALEIRNKNGSKLQVLTNALERRDSDNKPGFIRFTILKASDRLQYEQNLRHAKAMAEEELLKQKEMLLLREQLIAVLGHDLRNPLSAIAMAAELLETTVKDEEAVLVATLKKSSSRMTELVQNIMDFARARLGEGIKLNQQDTTLEPMLQQVITELRITYPKREISASFDMEEPVYCDPYRIAQLLSNLLANAITHGLDKAPVNMSANHQKGILTIQVSNQGVPIPIEVQDDLFAPFKREERRPSQQGLGLGLYICKEIARAHNGTLSFESNDVETCFTFQMTTNSSK